jgi:hypothetical protein
VLFAKEGQETGKVGILKTHPSDHDLTITVTKHPAGGNPQRQTPIPRGQIGNVLTLDIINPTQRTITIRNRRQVNRKKDLSQPPDEPDSIKWFLDLERAGEMYPTAIGANQAELVPLLTFNSGELFTAGPLSQDFLLVQKGLFSPLGDFGRVALTIGIDFIAEQAIFLNSASPDPVFNSQPEPNTDYTIEIVHDAPNHGHIVTDANFYYSAVGQNIPLNQLILFTSLNVRTLLENMRQEAFREEDKALAASIENILRKLGPQVGPEAACFPAHMSQTNL